jgi:hypothetical protein
MDVHVFIRERGFSGIGRSRLLEPNLVQVSDLLLGRMGREVCCAKAVLSEHQEAMREGHDKVSAGAAICPYAGCLSPMIGMGLLTNGRPLVLQVQVSDSGPQLLVPQMPPDFFSAEDLTSAAERFLDEFERYQLIRNFLEGKDGTWTQANLVMALLLGFR